MSQYEEIFMAGFANAFSSEKTAGETPVLDKALGNLGLLEEEAVEMPVLKQAMENLGLLEEETGGDEPSSMLEALAVAYGPAVIAEREKTAALEKAAGPAAAMRGLMSKYKGGMKEFGRGAKKLVSSYRPKKGKPGKRTPRPKGAALAKLREAAKKGLKKGAPAAGATAGAGVLGLGAAALALRKKKKEKK